MKISSTFHRLLIYDVKRTTQIDGMGPFKNLSYYLATTSYSSHHLCRLFTTLVMIVQPNTHLIPAYKPVRTSFLARC